MPVAPRPKGKAKDIADNILGVPDNLKTKKRRKKSKISERLIAEETKLVR